MRTCAFRGRQRLAGVVACLGLAVLCAWPATSVVAADAVWEAMRQPGAVVVLRHSYAPGGFDPPTARLDDCSTQRNLDDNGRAQARRVGEAFKANGLTVGPVLSSPRCRCLDTARLAFGRVETLDALQGALTDTERRNRQLAEIRRVMDEHHGSAPLVLVTHGTVVSDLTQRSIRMGEFVVLRRTATGSYEVAGQLYVE